MALRDYLRIIRRNWVLIVALMLVGFGLAAAYSIRISPTYHAATKVFISPESARSLSELNQGNTFTLQAVQSYASIVNTPTVLQPVISKLGLSTSSAALSEHVEASAAVGSTIIMISVNDRSPSRAAAIANAVADRFSQVVADISPQTISGTIKITSTNAIKVTILERAVPPSSPSSPNIPLNLVLGGGIGLAVGFGIAVARYLLDTRVRRIVDIVEITRIPVLGGIAMEPKRALRPLVVADEPRSARAEAFRSLRTNFQFLDYGGRPHSFVFTSATEGEGKTTTLANLAVALSDSGSKVVVVDADLRKPRLAATFGLHGEVGLTNVLIGKVSMNDALQRWGTGELHVLAAGGIPPNPSELLGSQPMTDLLNSLVDEFDIVLVDAPPLLPVTDAAILSRRTGGAILVAAVGIVHRNQVKGALEVLHGVDADVLGVVVTRVPTKGVYASDVYNYGYEG